MAAAVRQPPCRPTTGTVGFPKHVERPATRGRVGQWRGRRPMAAFDGRDEARLVGSLQSESSNDGLALASGSGPPAPDAPGKGRPAPCIPVSVLQAGRASWLPCGFVGVKGCKIPPQRRITPWWRQRSLPVAFRICPLTPSAFGRLGFHAEPSRRLVRRYANPEAQEASRERAGVMDRVERTARRVCRSVKGVPFRLNDKDRAFACFAGAAMTLAALIAMAAMA